MDNNRLQAHSISELWKLTTNLLLDKGDKKLNHELLNLIMVLDDFREDVDFDLSFRSVFGDERVDYASGVTFVHPTGDDYDGWEYKSVIEGKWSKTYWGRMWNWNGEFNQIEQSIKRLKEKKNSKTISISIYNPSIDGKKTQAGIPCLLSLDIKPRSDGLYITAFYRSMRISKSGYADFKGLVELGKFISYRSELRLKRITIMGSSVHLGSQNGEMVNTKKLLGMI